MNNTLQHSNWKRNSCIQEVKVNDQPGLLNLSDGSMFSPTQAQLALLKTFETPTQVTTEREDDSLIYLKDNFLIVEEGGPFDGDGGFWVRRASSGFSPIDAQGLKDLKQASSIILGVPIDFGSKRSGSSDGPTVIRNALQKHAATIQQTARSSNAFGLWDFSTRRRYDLSKNFIFDAGDIAHDRMRDPRFAYNKLEISIDRILAANCIPILVGGDHSISYFAARRFSNLFENTHIVVFDAHHDIYFNSYNQRKNLNHGNWLAHLLQDEHGPDVTVVGCRTLDFASPRMSELLESSRLKVFSSLDIEYNSSAILDHICTNSPNVYLSFDIDVLDCSSDLITKTPIVGGASQNSVMYLYNQVLRLCSVRIADYVEVCDGGNPASTELDVIAKLMVDAMLQTCEVQNF